MDNNSLISNVESWERGKDYPEFFDEISLATISKVTSYQEKHLRKHTEE
jgi:hypothetical protein